MKSLFRVKLYFSETSVLSRDVVADDRTSAYKKVLIETNTPSRNVLKYNVRMLVRGCA